MKSTDHQLFLVAYRPIHEAFVRYCSSRAFGWMETEDLVQEAILATLVAFNRIRKKEKLLNYMIGIVNNILRNQRRKLKFRSDWDAGLLSSIRSRVADPELALDIQYLHKAIRQLPEQQQEAILLFEISGFSIREIAEIQKSSEGAVKTRLSRARKRLRHLLSESETKVSLSQRLAIYASVIL